jgi:hypothetical protein
MITASTVVGMEMREVLHHDARLPDVRTTVILDADVAAAVAGLRRERGLGLSEALNELARAGMQAPESRPRFRQRSVDMGIGIDVRDTAEALELAEGPAYR